MTDQAITVSEKPIQIDRMGLTQNAAGYVHSPWFTVDLKHWTLMNYAHIREISRHAFCSALGIPEDRVVMTEMHSPEDLTPKWRWGTAMPLAPLTPPKPQKVRDPLAIDI